MFLGREISEQRDYSDNTAHDIDEEVHWLIDEAHKQAKSILERHKAKLVQLARHLMTNETIEGADLINLLDSEPPPMGVEPMPMPANN